MQRQTQQELDPVITVEIVDHLSENDLADLCDATEITIKNGGGFGWVEPPPRQVLERYWFGAMAVPERYILVARLDGVICGAVQMVQPSKNNQAQSFAVTLLACFVAPWARGHNIGAELLKTGENLAIEKGYKLINLDVRETQDTAIELVEGLDYTKWGENPYYAVVDNKPVTGYFYSKIIGEIIQNEEPAYLKIADVV